MGNFILQDFSFSIIPEVHAGSENSLIKKNKFLNLKTTEQVAF